MAGSYNIKAATFAGIAVGGWKGAIILGYTSAARLMDVCNMRWSSLDLENGLLEFRVRKTGKKAVIGLHPDFTEWLASQPPSYDPHAYLFPSLAGRVGAGKTGLSNEFKGIMKRANIVGKELKSEGGNRLSTLSFHSLRHSSATSIYGNAALESIPKRVTQHSSRALKKYVHQDIEVLKAATQLIPRLPKAAQ